MSGASPKPSRGQALREKHAAKLKEAKELAALYRQVYKRDQYRCVACHRSVVVGAIDDFKRAHPHHVKPRSLHPNSPQLHTTENVTTLCNLCHADVGDRTLVIRGNADLGVEIRREGVA